MTVYHSNGFESLGDLTVAQPFLELFRRNNLTSLESLMSLESAELLRKPGLPSWRERLRMELSDGAGGVVTLFMKRYSNPPRGGFGSQGQGSAGHGTAWAEWRWMREIAQDNVACVRPVAYGELMEGRRERFSAVVTEAVPGVSLETWTDQQTSRCPRWMVVALAEFVRRFHSAGYVHRDLYLSHIFFDATAERDAAFRMIDLQRVMKPTWRRRRWQVKDLAALAYSTPASSATACDRVRFLRHYLGVQRLGSGGKRLMRAISAKRAGIARHDQRRQRNHARFHEQGGG